MFLINQHTEGPSLFSHIKSSKIQIKKTQISFNADISDNVFKNMREREIERESERERERKR